MADKGPGSVGRSNKKRLARAKIKPTEYGIKSSKRQTVEEPQPTKNEVKKERKQKITAIAIGIFAVIMALSMMLPSLSYIFGDNSAQAPEAEQPAQSESTDASKDEDESSDEKEEAADKKDEAADEKDEAADDADTATNSQVATIDSNYKAVIDPLEEKLASNPDDLATLLNLGNDYQAWAQEASSYTTGDDYTHVSDLYNKAIGYYDKYLERNDSNAVKVSRALCQLSLGEVDEATKALTAVADEANYAPAWRYLGVVQEYYLGDSATAKETYQKAIDADPDDEYGAKSYANQRLAAMAASANGGELEEGATEKTDADSSTEGAAALAEALKGGK